MINGLMADFFKKGIMPTSFALPIVSGELMEPLPIPDLNQKFRPVFFSYMGLWAINMNLSGIILCNDIKDAIIVNDINLISRIVETRIFKYVWAGEFCKLSSIDEFKSEQNNEIIHWFWEGYNGKNISS